MTRSRSVAVIGAGVIAVGCAIAAMTTDTAWVVLLGAAFALLAIGIIIDGYRHGGSSRRASRSELAAQAAHLAQENDEAVARAARFKDEAVQARSELADAMRLQFHPQDDVPTVQPPRPEPEPASDDDVIVDSVTGLFSQVFFDASLIKRVSAARRGLRPLSIAVADVVVGVGTPDVVPAPAEPVAVAMQAVFREADTLARTQDGQYLILLEDTPENGAIWTLERLRRRLAETLPGHTLWVGLSCYPAYGFDPDQLMVQARGALGAAREWQQDRIEVTTATPD